MKVNKEKKKIETIGAPGKSHRMRIDKEVIKQVQ